MPLLYVLDHNFPVLAAAAEWPPSIQVVALAQFAPALRAAQDWELLQSLDARGDVDGLITLDGDMLNLPREMVVLSRSGLTLVVMDGVGNNPLRATGLLMVYLNEIAKHPSRPPRNFRLRPGSPQSLSVDKHLNALATKRNTTPPEMIRQVSEELPRRPRLEPDKE